MISSRSSFSPLVKTILKKKKKIRNKIKRSGYIWALNRNDIDRRRKRRRRREAWSNSSMNPMIVNNRGNELKSFDGRDICRRFLIKSRFNDSPRYIFPSANEPGKKRCDRHCSFATNQSIPFVPFEFYYVSLPFLRKFAKFGKWNRFKSRERIRGGEEVPRER